MNFLPFFYHVEDQPCLVVGGGAIAARKAELLLRAGARVLLVAPEVDERVQEMARERRLEIERREFVTGDLEQMLCVIAATDDAAQAEIFRH